MGRWAWSSDAWDFDHDGYSDLYVANGYISGAAALVATALAPGVGAYLIASHCSAEPGHRIVLSHLRLMPLLDLGLRLGEGTGAAIAMHLIDDATAILDEMATFVEAGVSGREDSPVVESEN